MIAETRSAQLARRARSLSVLSHNKNRACHSSRKAQLDSALLHLADWLSPDRKKVKHTLENKFSSYVCLFFYLARS